MSDLLLADDLALTSSVGTEKLAILGQSGSGKSYLARKLAELMVAAGIQVVAVDPVGCWYGLRVAGDGPGLPVVVFGGEHGDLPLGPSTARAIADALVDLAASAVLDLSDLEMPDQKRFVAAFAEQFFHRKKRAKSPVHLILEEAQILAPQFPERDETVMLNRIERICRIGRNYGIGWTIVSQRPQEVHKKVLNQAGTLFALRTVGRHERKAIADWVVDKASAADSERLESLPSLETGTAHVWSPAYLRLSRTVRVLRCQTFDSSRTPEIGESQAARELAPIDLDRLREVLADATIGEEAADQKSVRDLRRAVSEQGKLIAEQEETIRLQEARIAELERQLRDRAFVASDDLIEKAAEAHVRIWRVEDALEAMLNEARPARMAAGRVTHELQERSCAPSAAAPNTPVASAPEPGSIHRSARPTESRSSDPALSVAPARGGSPPQNLTGPQKRVLNALAMCEGFGEPEPTRAMLAAVAGYRVTSSNFNNLVSSLRTAGLAEYPGDGLVSLTAAGRGRAIGRTFSNLAELHEAWSGLLSGPQRRVLDPLILAYPQAMHRSELAAVAGYSETSSNFNNLISSLKTLGVATYPQSGYVAASVLLFPEGLER